MRDRARGRLSIAGITLAFSATALVSSCGSDPEPTPPVVQQQHDLTWYRDIEPIVQVKCDGCHAEGGIGPVVFNDTTVQALAGLMVSQISSGLMPPWQPSDEGPPLKGERRLTQAEIDKITAWAADGAPLGSDADHEDLEPEKTFSLTDPDISVKLPAPYMANKELEDDVRCFVIDLNVPENTWVRATRFVVDQKSAVHH